jgi:hypothetical protein
MFIYIFFTFTFTFTFTYGYVGVKNIPSHLIPN